MRLLATVVWLATVSSLVWAGMSKEQKEAVRQRELKEAVEAMSEQERKLYLKTLKETKDVVVELTKEPKQEQGIKWHSMSDIRKLQNEGLQLLVVRIDPIDIKDTERRMEIVAAEMRARSIDDVIWVKRSVGDDDPIWLRWEQIPVTTQLFLLPADPKAKAIVYMGPETFTDQLSWMLEHVQEERPKMLWTEAQLEAFMLAAPVSVIAYVPEDNKDYLKFVKKVAARHPYLPVGVVHPSEAVPYTKHELSPFCIYYRDEDHVFSLDEDKLQEMDDFTRDNALKKASNQFISRFPEDAQHIFSQGIDKIVFFFDIRGEKRGQTPSYLRELALEMRQYVVIAFVNSADEHMNGVREFFGVEKEPCVRGFDHRTERQYWPMREQGTQMPHEIQQFVRDFAFNRLEAHRKVEEIAPEVNSDGQMVKLNTNTFEEMALDPSRDVAVLFFTTWCPHSKRFAYLFLQAAEESKGKRGVLFAAVDVEKNDVETTNKIRVFPTLILFRKHTNEEVVYMGRRTKGELLRWIDDEAKKGEDMRKKEESTERVLEETDYGYESALARKLKRDYEQKYTIDMLEHDEEDMKRGKQPQLEFNDHFAQKVLEKLRVDKPTIMAAMEIAKEREKSQEEKKQKLIGGGKKKKDTVDSESTVGTGSKKNTVTNQDGGSKKDAAESDSKKSTVTSGDAKETGSKKSTVSNEDTVGTESKTEKKTTVADKTTTPPSSPPPPTHEAKKDTVDKTETGTVDPKEMEENNVIDRSSVAVDDPPKENSVKSEL